MTPEEPAQATRRAARWIAWFTVVRGCLALALGAALLLQRDGTTRHLATFMGLYWLSGGIVALGLHRQLRAIGERRLPLLAGLFGVVAGTGLLVREVVVKADPSANGTILLVAILIFVNGLTNFVSGIRTGDGLGRTRSRESAVLGGTEVLLAIVLILSRDAPSSVALLVAAIWAFVAGWILLGRGLRLLRREVEGPIRRPPSP